MTTQQRSAGLIPAAGMGERLGLGPKAFIECGGLTLIEHAVARLAPAVDRVVVALPPGGCHEKPPGLTGVVCIEGRSSRRATVQALLEAVDEPWVVVHDAARPFTPTEVFKRVLNAAYATNASSATLPVADTLHHEGQDQPVDRHGLVAIQTPQGFKRETLLHAHQNPALKNVRVTDDAQLVRMDGGAVSLVDGSRRSHKITFPEDLPFVEALMRGWVNDA